MEDKKIMNDEELNQSLDQILKAIQEMTNADIAMIQFKDKDGNVIKKKEEKEKMDKEGVEE